MKSDSMKKRQVKSRISKRIVNVKFKENISEKLINDVLKHHKFVSKVDWTFNFQQYKKSGADQVFAISQIILIESLTLHFCQNPLIIKQVRQINFPRLKNLNLCGNKLSSIEGLHTLNLQNLEYLFLRENNLTNFKILRKCNFKLVRPLLYKIYLEISENKMVTYQDLWSGIDYSRLQNLDATRNNASLDIAIIKSQMDFRKLKMCNFGRAKISHINRRFLFDSLGNLGVPNPHFE